MMKLIRIALCDDSDMERRIIRKMIDQYLEEHDYPVQVDEFPSGDALLKSDVTSYDLMILDIYMGGINGIDTAKELLSIHPKGRIIFCSSSNEFAEESYDVEAFRYLVKPLSAEKLHQCFDRFFKLCTDKKVLEYKYQRTVRSMLLKDVVWIEAAGRHSIIHTLKEQIETNTSLAEFTEQLWGTDFVKPIRYALVSLSAVTELTADTLVLTDGMSIPVSREKRKEIQEAFMRFQA